MPTDYNFDEHYEEHELYRACDGHNCGEIVEDGYQDENAGNFLCFDCRALCSECGNHPAIGEYPTGEEGLDRDHPATMFDPLCAECREKQRWRDKLIGLGYRFIGQESDVGYE